MPGICVCLSCFQVVPVMEYIGQLRWIVGFVVKEEQLLGGSTVGWIGAGVV